jgi:hypothetical protein
MCRPDAGRSVAKAAHFTGIHRSTAGAAATLAGDT